MGRDYPDRLIERVLTESRTIALVGASPRADRPSYGVMRFLQSRGHKVYPVNPIEAGNTINGETVLASLDDLPAPVDMVDIFRRSSQAGEVVDDAIRIGARTVWMQLDVIDDDAAHRAEQAGLTVIMDRCPVIEYRRLGI
jgi:predicted CoA-binding protein